MKGIAAPSTLADTPPAFAPSANSPEPVSPGCPDFNGNGKVDFPDFIEFAGNFGKNEGDADFDIKYDLDSSGSIGFGDFIMFTKDFGLTIICPNIPNR